MTRPDEETLMAFADNLLTGAERDRVATIVATDPAVRAQVDAIRAQNKQLQAAFDAPMRAEAPDHLVNLILGSGSALATSGKDTDVEPAPTNVVAFKPRPSIWSQPRQMLPLAASMLLAVGLGIVVGRGSGITDNASIAVGPQPIGSQVAQILEQQPTGVARASLLVVATFRDRAGRVCREFERLGGTDGNVPTAAAVACRSSNGQWVTEGAARIAAAATGPGFTPSGASERDALDGLMAMLGAGPALDASAEAALRAKGWQP